MSNSPINEDTREAWQYIANEVSKQRPDPGKRVRVSGGRKYKGITGTVVRNIQDKYVNAFRYGNEASFHMREMERRYGFVVLVQPDDASIKPFWTKADNVEVIDTNGQVVR